MFLIDWYIWSGIKPLIPEKKIFLRRIIGGLFWGFTLLSLVILLIAQLLPEGDLANRTRTLIFLAIGLPLLSKLLTALLLLIDDLRRGAQWGWHLLTPQKKPAPSGVSGKTIPRSEFLSKTAMLAGGGLGGTFIYGILSGAHDYRIRRIQIPLANLPASFHGIRIAQLSDIHSGSFFNKTAVKGGIQLLLDEKPDLAVFTGDLVNDQTKEVKEYFDIFEKVKAPLGVYSVLGNHDYGEYYRWPSRQAKEQNLRDMHEAHRRLGWDLLNDNHRKIEVGGEAIELLGVQNWGGGRFPKYGNLDKARHQTDDSPVKILLSHDPSHWDLQVLQEFPDIDIMLAGHTHGMQFGVEIPGFRWSPAQYNYKHWAGLYRERNQFLYVNRGFGFLGYPGRVGILPEITIIELVKA